jgi:hypothetical protein
MGFGLGAFGVLFLFIDFDIPKRGFNFCRLGLYRCFG